VFPPEGENCCYPPLFFPQRGKIFHKNILKTKQHFPLPLGEGPRVRGKSTINSPFVFPPEGENVVIPLCVSLGGGKFFIKLY